MQHDVAFDNMSIEVVHLHGFKCAGTTLATLLAQNFGTTFRCVESTERAGRLPWSQVVGHPDLVGIRAVSSHTITPPPQGAGPLVIGLVRSPAERLISAWRFFQQQSKQPDFPFSGYLKRQSKLENYQTRLYSPQLAIVHDGLPLWGQHFNHMQLGHNYFIGTVDRFAESLVIIQYLLSLRGINFRAFISTENAAISSDHKTAPDAPIPESYLSVDKLLYRRCNELINTFRDVIPNFETRLKAIQPQIQVESQFRYLIDQENVLKVQVSH